MSNLYVFPDPKVSRPFKETSASLLRRLLPHVRRAVPVRLRLGREGGRGPGARGRDLRGDEREALRRREQRREDRPPRGPRLPGRRRARTPGAEREVLRPHAEPGGGAGEHLHAVQLPPPDAAPHVGNSRRLGAVAARRASRASSRPSSCWIQMWVELPDAAAVAAYQDFLDAYALEQKKTRPLPAPAQQPAVDDRGARWTTSQVVPQEANALLVVSLLFLAVCSVNLVGLLLGKFLARAPEVGVRRALGASRLDIFVQHIVECELVGLVGGVLGLALSPSAPRGPERLLQVARGRGRLLPARRPDGRALGRPRARRGLRRGRVPRVAHVPLPARAPPEDLLRRRPWNSDRSSAR